MNDIRFRIWDEFNKKWIEHSEFTIGATDGLVRQKGIAGAIGGVEAVQSTGLSDKHGRDGFKGDIFKITQGRHYWIYEIMEFSEITGNNLCAVCREHNCSSIDGIYTYEPTEPERIQRDCISKLKAGTILRNIYENTARDPQPKDNNAK